MPILSAKDVSDMLGISLSAAKSKLRRSVSNNNCRSVPKNRQNDITYYDIPDEYIANILVKRAKLIYKKSSEIGKVNDLHETLIEIHKYLIIVKLENIKFKSISEKAESLLIKRNLKIDNLSKLSINQLEVISHQSSKMQELESKLSLLHREIEIYKNKNKEDAVYIKKLEKNALFYKIKYVHSQRSLIKKLTMRLRKALTGK